jgi:hypothetical protein
MSGLYQSLPVSDPVDSFNVHGVIYVEDEGMLGTGTQLHAF